MYCSHCGKEVSSDAKYCNHCGAELAIKNTDRNDNANIAANDNCEVHDPKDNKGMSIDEKQEEVNATDDRLSGDEEQQNVSEGKVKSSSKINSKRNIFLGITSLIAIFAVLACTNVLYSVPIINFFLYDVLGNQSQYIKLVNTCGVSYQDVVTNPEKYSGKYIKLDGYVVDLGENKEDGIQNFTIIVEKDLGGDILYTGGDGHSVFVTCSDEDTSAVELFDAVTLYGKIDGITFKDENNNGEQDENEPTRGPSVDAKYVTVENTDLKTLENYKAVTKVKNAAYNDLITKPTSYLHTPVCFEGEVIAYNDFDDYAMAVVATNGYIAGSGEMVYYDEGVGCLLNSSIETLKEGNIVKLYGTFEGNSTMDGETYPVVVTRYLNVTGQFTWSQPNVTNYEMTLEEAREYLIQCMYEVHPDFDAREDFAYSLQGEDEDCYSSQVLVKNAQTTSNNMGFYSVFKNSGEVYDDIFGELIWTPYDGLIN